MIKRIETLWQSMSAAQIILLCLLVGLVVGLIVGWRTSLPDQRQIPPYALPSLSADATAIESLSSRGFFDADIRIQAADGQTYTFIPWEEEGQKWSADAFAETTNEGEPCSTEITNLMQASAGPIVECSTAAIVGEWCPGPIISVAITEMGEVWQTDEYKPCTYVYERSIFLIEIPFLLLGLVIAIFRWLMPNK